MNSEKPKAIATNVWRRNGFGKTITPKGGKFSASESALVKEAVEKYCQSHGVTSSRLCSDADNRTDHLRGAWMEIAQALPHRTVQSVYRHGLRILHPFKRGTWSEEETKQLMLYVSTLGKKWSEIQGKLNRSADSCRDKYREFHQDYTKGKWGTEDSQKLEKLVRGYLKVGDDVSLKELGNIAEDNRDQIPWSVISEKMGNRSRLSCFKRFQLMTGTKTNYAKKAAIAMVTEATTNAAITAESETKKRKREVSSVPVVQSPVKITKETSEHSYIEEAPLPTIEEQIAVTDVEPVAFADMHDGKPEANADPFADISDDDRKLLTFVANSNLMREYEINWSHARYPHGNAKDRFYELVERYIEASFSVDEDEFQNKAICEQAKDIVSFIDNREAVEEEDPAELAARTVEAVFLEM